jgi:hypothetical protein
MIYHVLRLKLKQDTPEETRRQVYEGLHGFREIEAVEDVLAGWSARGGSDYDLGAVIVLRDEEAFAAYLYDPIHLALDKLARPHVAAAQAFDLSDDLTPGLAARLDALGTGREQDEELSLADLGEFTIER